MSSGQIGTKRTKQLGIILLGLTVGVVALVAVPYILFAQSPAAVPLAQVSRGSLPCPRPEEGGESFGIMTGVQIQNVGEKEANASLYLVSEVGNPVFPSGHGIAEDGLRIRAGAAHNLFLPAFNDIPGDNYSFVAEANQPIRAIVVTTCNVNKASGIYDSVESSKEIIVPFLYNDYLGQNAQITIQNADSKNEAEIKVEVIRSGDRGTVTSGISFKLKPDRAQIYRSENLLGTDNDGVFVGYARIMSDRDTVVHSFIEMPHGNAISSFSGIPVQKASKELFAPLVRCNYYGDTVIQLVNTEHSDGNITITYYTDPLVSPKGFSQVYTTSHQIAGQDTITLFLRSTGILPEGDRNVDAGGWFGVAKIESDVELVGSVQDAVFSFEEGTTTPVFVTAQGIFNLAVQEDSATRFALPLVRSLHMMSEKLTTGVQIQNVSPVEATVAITYFVGNESMRGDDVRVQPGGSANIYQGASEIAGLFGPELPEQDGWYGSAIVTSDQPVILFVNDASGPGAEFLYDQGNYMGIPLR
jgi:hypothetical protein